MQHKCAMCRGKKITKHQHGNKSSSGGKMWTCPFKRGSPLLRMCPQQPVKEVLPLPRQPSPLPVTSSSLTPAAISKKPSPGSIQHVQVASSGDQQTESAYLHVITNTWFMNRPCYSVTVDLFIYYMIKYILEASCFFSLIISTKGRPR